MLKDAIKKFRYHYWPSRAIGELLAKQWMETAVPLIVLLLVIAVFASIIDGFLRECLKNLPAISRHIR